MSGTKMSLDQLNVILALGVAGVSASEAGKGVFAASAAVSESIPAVALSAIVVGVCLAVVSVFAMACCGFLRRRQSKADDDQETTAAETGNAMHLTAGNDVGMSHQSRPFTDVSDGPLQTTSFNLQNEIVRVGPPFESNGPQKPNTGAMASRGELTVSPVTTEFKDRSNSLASLGIMGNQAVQAVTLVSRDNRGIGLSVDGERTDDGIFVKTIHPGGPAAESHRLNSGDRIVSMAICMEKMTLDDAQTLFQLARFYPVELHYVKGSPEAVAAIHLERSPVTVESPIDAVEERGRSQSASCLPSIEGDAEKTRLGLHPDRSSSSLTHLPPPGQISRWRNEAELSPDIKFQNNGSTFEEDVRTMSELASAKLSGKQGGVELDRITAEHHMNSVNSSEGGRYPGERTPPVAAAGSFTGGNWRKQGIKDRFDVDSGEDDEEDRVNRINSEDRVIDNGGYHLRVDALDGEDSLVEPTWQSDFKIDLPHLDDNSAYKDSRPNPGDSEVVDANDVVVTSAFQGDGDFENSWKLSSALNAEQSEQKKEATEVGLDLNQYRSGWNQNAVEDAKLTEDLETYQNNREISKIRSSGFDFSSSYETEDDKDQTSNEQAAISVNNVRPSEGISWKAANSPDLSSDVEEDDGVIRTSNPLSGEITIKKHELSFGLKADRGKESYSDQGHESVEEEASNDVKVDVIQTGVAVDTGDDAKLDLRGPSGYFGSQVHSRGTNEHGFDHIRAATHWQARNMSGGPGLHRSPAAEQEQEVKVVDQGRSDSYYDRFCETVETGLPSRVVDLDVVDEGLEKEEEQQTVLETELRFEAKKSEGRDLEQVGSPGSSVNGPNFEEWNSVPLVSGSVSPEISTGVSQKQSPPHSKETKVKSSTSIGGRLKGFFSQKKGTKETSVRVNDFAYSSSSPPSPQKSSTEVAPLPYEAPKSLLERNSTGFDVSMTGAQPQLSVDSQNGKGEKMDEEVEETWASIYSYAVNGGGTVSTVVGMARRVLEFPSLRMGSAEEDVTRADEDLVEDSERKGDDPDYDYPRKHYAAEVEDDGGSEDRVQNGNGKYHAQSDGAPGFVFDGKDFNEFYYGMAFYGKDRVDVDGVKDGAEEQNDLRVQPAGAEGETRANGIDGGHVVSESELTAHLQHQHQLSSDDEDEIISYSSNAQTRPPPVDDGLPQERIAEYGKEKNDRRAIDAALSTSSNQDTFEFLDLNQFSLEPLELPSWESLDSSSPQPNGFEGSSISASASYTSNATKHKTKELNLTTSEDRNNNTLLESSNA